jgi:hypothetical protein
LNMQCLGIDRYPSIRVSDYLARWLIIFTSSLTTHFLGQDQARLKALTDEIRLWTSRRSNYEPLANRPAMLSLEHHMTGDVQVGVQHPPYAFSSSSQTVQPSNIPYQPDVGAPTDIGTTNPYEPPDGDCDDGYQDGAGYPVTEDFDADAEGGPEGMGMHVVRPMQVSPQMQPGLGGYPTLPAHYPPPPGAPTAYNLNPQGYSLQAQQSPLPQSTQYPAYYLHQPPSQLSALTVSPIIRATTYYNLINRAPFSTSLESNPMPNPGPYSNIIYYPHYSTHPPEQPPQAENEQEGSQYQQGHSS